MKRFEYFWLALPDSLLPSDWLIHMNSFGREGWETTGITEVGDVVDGDTVTHYLMKREHAS